MQPPGADVARGFRGDCKFMKGQEAMVRAAKPGEVLMAYRSGKGDHGCSWLTNFLIYRCGWVGGRCDTGPACLAALSGGDNDVVIDINVCHTVGGPQCTKLFAGVHAVPGKRVIVMYAGVPPVGAWLELDITGCTDVDIAPAVNETRRVTVQLSRVAAQAAQAQLGE